MAATGSGFIGVVGEVWIAEWEARRAEVSRRRAAESRWAIVNLVGKHGRVRTAPMPSWASAAMDEWATAAGIYSAYAEPAAVSTHAADAEYDLEDIVEQAIRTGDEHAIKFVEACLHEHRRSPDPLFLAAAADAAARLMP